MARDLRGNEPDTSDSGPVGNPFSPGKGLTGKEDRIASDAHRRSDVDAGSRSQHHTLGYGAGQAAPGKDAERLNAMIFRVGALQPYWFNVLFPEKDWMLCNGATLTRTTYPELFRVIGTTFGAPSGTTFSLPNYGGSLTAPYWYMRVK